MLALKRLFLTTENILITVRKALAGNVARMKVERNDYKILNWKEEGKRPLGRPRRKREDNITIDFREFDMNFMNWINLAQDIDQWETIVNTVWTFRIHELLASSWVAERPVASQGGLS
jgi:hypothetical protein